MEIRAAGENALIIRLGDTIDPQLLAKVRQLTVALEQHLGELLVDLIPAYGSVVVVYDTRRTHYRRLRRAILELPPNATGKAPPAGKRIELPVHYSTQSGPDLARVAALNHCDITDVIDRHSQRDYLVYAIGFAPGFAYLGEVDDAIATPRHRTPRLRVPRGAVAIADRQTAVYPAPSPGGWNLIGLCPTPLFRPDANPAVPIAVGDLVRFRPISRGEFLALGGEL